MSEPVQGPTVYEAAMTRIRRIDANIAELQNERALCKRRADRYMNSPMLEAERIATEAEKFLPPLPDDFTMLGANPDE